MVTAWLANVMYSTLSRAIFCAHAKNEEAWRGESNVMKNDGINGVSGISRIDVAKISYRGLKHNEKKKKAVSDSVAWIPGLSTALLRRWHQAKKSMAAKEPHQIAMQAASEKKRRHHQPA